MPSPLSCFFSWQSDSPPPENTDFIQECLKEASAQLGSALGAVIVVDRDTAGIGGTPNVSETIFQKIRACDLFIWDATLVAVIEKKTPKYAPNPNVLLELGYAVAFLGWNRVIGIMNVANGKGTDLLPFHLSGHRRYPIKYCLTSTDPAQKAEIEKALVEEIKKALHEASLQPKDGAIRADTDFRAAAFLWGKINSPWLLNWRDRRNTYPQYEWSSFTDVCLDYLNHARLPENLFSPGALQDSHREFLLALRQYLDVLWQNMISPPGDTTLFVVRAKYEESQGRLFEDPHAYDRAYDSQMEAVRIEMEKVWSSWSSYVLTLREVYPEVVASLG